jgi:hypothetical protein
MAYLKRMDIDTLKIDRSFVRDLTTDPSDLAITEAIIAMAHKLDINVVAEGIETDAQRERLADAGCDFGQGYLFSPPLPEDAFFAYAGARARCPRRPRAGTPKSCAATTCCWPASTSSTRPSRCSTPPQAGHLEQGHAAPARLSRVAGAGRHALRGVRALQRPARRIQRRRPQPAEVERLVAERMAAVRAFQPHNAERTRPNGQVLSIRGVPIPNLGFVTLWTDITEQRRYEQLIESQNAELETACAAAPPSSKPPRPASTTWPASSPAASSACAASSTPSRR